MSATPRCGASSGSVAVAQRGDHRAHLVERARRLLLDHARALDGAVRVATPATRPAGLGADRDRRDVVGDRVVQLAGELLALAELTWSSSRSRETVQIAHGGPERRREEQEDERADRVADAGPVAGDAEDVGEHDDRHAERDLAARSPAEQRVQEQQHARRWCRARPARRGRASAATPTHVAVPNAKRDRRERVRAPPQQREREPTRQHERDAGATRGRRAGWPRAPPPPAGPRRQRPVPPHARGSVRSAGLGPQRPDGVCEHAPQRREPAPAARIGQKDGSRPVRRARRFEPDCPMCATRRPGRR